jgi:cytochrome c553
MKVVVSMRGLALVSLIAMANVLTAGTPSKIEYNRDVRPILSENCFACHGADSAARKAKLRLDRFEDAIAPREGGNPAIVPGKPNESEVVSRIYNTNEDDLMPPAKTHKVLTPAQKDLLKRWIAAGAKYEPHWSLIAPVRTAVPKVRDAKWVRNPIDNFVLALLEQVKLKPAPEADRRTLARRLSLDLTGLPPSPADVEAFVNDKSPDAYEKLVDKFLASPHWGEHRGRYWLDAARYGDTHGIHIDNYREIWTYRDWVINALNKNTPFDRFTVEQLAGDLLPNATLEQKIASGFNRCNITTSEGGAIDEEYLVLYARDRTETASQVWLGLTTGCAVCHDHKYDPIKQKDFYSLSAFFNNTTQKAMDGNVKDTPPIVAVPRAEDRERWDALSEETVLGKKRVDDRKKSAKPDFDTWMENGAAAKLSASVPKDKLLTHIPLSDNAETNLTLTIGSETRTLSFTTNLTWQDGAVAEKAFSVRAVTTPEIPDVGDFERDQPVTYAAWVKLSDSRDGAVFARMDESKDYRGWDLWLEKGRPGTHIISKWPEDAIKVVARKELPKDRWAHVCVTYDGTSKVSGVKVYIDGEVQELEVQADKLKNTIHSEVPFKIGQRHKTSPVEKTGVQDIRIYGRVLTPDEVRDLGNGARMAWLASKPADKRDKKEGEELFTRWLTSGDKEYLDATKALDRLKGEENEIKMRGTIAHVMSERDAAAEAYLLFRGEYDKRRDKVGPETPAALPPMPADLPRNRLGLAKWLLRAEHPLTARVTVNRFWQELFGTGIVKTAGDFGVAGEMPSHPELLDWLAVEFRESGWDVKKLFKLLVTSATYRQSATVTAEKISKDPPNRLLARGPRFRMDAEMIRDYALASSGLLVDKIGGPSVKPYQPEGVWEAVAMPNSDTSKYKRDDGEKLYRRSLYTFIKRSAPPAQMDIFNAPNRQTCSVRRERTDTPLQALVTLNDEQFIEAARALAQKTLKDGGAKDAERLDFMAKRLLARTFRPEERKVVESSLKDLLTHYQTDSKDAERLIAVGESKADVSLDKPTLAAYTMVANELMNLDEVLNK